VDLFKQAIDSEMQQLLDEGVYEIVPQHSIPSGAMLVLKVKRKPDGLIDKCKARLVVLGNRQTSDTYDSIKLLTARLATCKMFIALIPKIPNCVSRVIDIKGAYLKSSVKR
jgi:hypothetical protein